MVNTHWAPNILRRPCRFNNVDDATHVQNNYTLIRMFYIKDIDEKCKNDPIIKNIY